MKPRPLRDRRFSRTQRLKRPADFTHVMSHATRSADRYFTVLSRPRSNSPSRLGLAISKKAARRAVDRNRLKRLARESFRHCDASTAGVIAAGDAAAGVHAVPAAADGIARDFVVFARQGAAAQTARVLRHSLDRHFRRLHGSERPS